MSKLFAAIGCAAAVLAAPAVASADVHWQVDATFDDGGSLTGWFDINVYGYIMDYDLVTTAGSVVTTGRSYTPQNSYWNNSVEAPLWIEAWNDDPAYFGGLHLQFLNDLVTASASNPIVGGSPGPSWECRDSWICPDQAPNDPQSIHVPGATRYVAEGHAFASSGGVPEPATWALMILGFGTAGATLRRRRTAAA